MTEVDLWLKGFLCNPLWMRWGFREASFQFFLRDVFTEAGAQHPSPHTVWCTKEAPLNTLEMDSVCCALRKPH